jgi:hypothetical protein
MDSIAWILSQGFYRHKACQLVYLNKGTSHGGQPSAIDRKFDVRHGRRNITYNRCMGTNSLFGAECTSDQLIYVEQWVGQNAREGASVESACQMADGRGQFFLATVSFRRYTGPLGSNALETTIVIPGE